MRSGAGRTGGRIDALVTDGQSRAAVAGVRALGQAGLRILATGPRAGAPALWSRHARRRAIVAPPSDPGFAARLGELAAEYGPLVVHPAQEEAVEPLTLAMGSLPPEAIVPYPGPEPLRRLRDKRALAGLAEQAGLGAPTALAEGPAGAIAAAPPPAPVVVKSTGLSLALPAARLLEDDESLAGLLAALPPDEPIVVQERLGGPLMSVSLVLDRDGRVVARLQQVARRLWPPDAGCSAVAMTVPPEPELVERAAAVLSGAGYWGLAQLQFLRGARGPALIDVNPRYYGSLPLAIAAGVNLPAAWQCVALGQSLPEAGPYRAGVVYRWLEGDVRAALKGARSHLRPPTPRPSAGAMWTAGDPVPSALMAFEAAWAPVARRLP